MDIDEQARRIEAYVNDRIKKESQSWSRFDYRSQAERIANEEISEDWDWEIVEVIGGPPRFMLMQYLGGRHD